MLALDAYYTPDNMAASLLSYVVSTPHNAIDFCVGDGGLLLASERQFPGIDCYGIDISSVMIEKLQMRQPSWHLSHCDFMDVMALEEVSFLQGKSFDLIVLNPPFTCRGSRIHRVFIGNDEFNVSTAMSFLVGTLPFMSIAGAIYAILPISCVYSQKDQRCWKYLQENYHACVLAEVHKAIFSGRCAPNIVFVYLGRSPYPSDERRQNMSICKVGFSLADLHRGHLGFYQVKEALEDEGELPFIHTTNLKDGKLVEVKYIRNFIKEPVKGYGVLIPRVCNPNVGKLVVLNNEECVLSDCVILLQTRSKKEAIQLRRYLIDHWTDFKRNYVGTGAQYVTMERLRHYFQFES